MSDTTDGPDEPVPREPDAGAGVEPSAEPPLAGRTGWVALGVILLCLVAFPVAIVLWPPTFLPYTDAYLALSLVPGMILGGAGIWLALRGRR